MSFKRWITSVVLAAASCGAGFVAAAANLTASSSAYPDLSGRWSSPCEKCSGERCHSEAGYMGSTRGYLRVDGSDLRWGAASFSDINCAGERLGDVYFLVHITKVSGISYPRDIDLQYLGQRFTPWSLEAADKLNQIRMCGISDWKIGEERDLSGTVCDTGAMHGYMHRALYTVYDISGGTLELGDACGSSPPRVGCRSGTGPETRSTELPVPDHTFTRAN